MLNNKENKFVDSLGGLFNDKTNDIISKYVQETPFYMFYEKGFRNNLTSLCSAFRSIYTNYLPAYSYKTNYTPYICKVVKDMGGFAEVVSDMEYYVAKKIGYEDNMIIYNGPCKGPMMENHILNGGISNIDNKEEAHRVILLAQQHPDKEIKIGIRINSDIGANFISRFGLEVDSKELEDVVRLLKEQTNIRFVGLHMHVSRARGLQAWKRRAENILYAADKYIDGFPEYLDLGSGMFADMESFLKEQFTIDVPTYEEYAAVVAGMMASHYAGCEKKPLLITEPGTTLVSRYLSLVTTVKSTKVISGRSFAVVDSDYHNAGETCRMMKLPYTLYKNANRRDVVENPDIVGYTCLEQDCLFHSFPESVGIGYVIEFRNVGGYSIVYKPPFIRPNCRMLCIKPDGQVEEIKRTETYEDIFKTFKF